MFNNIIINILSLILIKYLICSYVHSKPDLCANPSNLDGIAFIDSMMMKWAFSKSGYYWCLIGDDLPTSANALALPHNFSKVDAIVVKDINKCEESSQNEFSLVFVTFMDEKLQYFTYKIGADSDVNPVSDPKLLKDDIIFGKANINFNKRLDTIFNGIASQIFFIQDGLYSEIEFTSCPKSGDSVTAHTGRPLTDLNISSPIDGAFFTDLNHINSLHMFHKQFYYQILLDKDSLFKGILKAVEITQNETKYLFQKHFDCPLIPDDINGTETEMSSESKSTEFDFRKPPFDWVTIFVFIFLFIVTIIVWSIVIYFAYGKRQQRNSMSEEFFNKYEKK